MKTRYLFIGLVVAALLAGFFVGWYRTLSLIGCPPTESDRLQAEIKEVRERIREANLKIAEVQKEHPEGRLK